MSVLNKWKYTGIIILIILGFILHDVFEWTNHSSIAGLFVPVNESVWEHLKLGYCALIIFTIIEYYFKSSLMHNYFTAKVIGILVLETTILLIYYGYKLFSTDNILALDISSYIVGVILCQVIIHRFYNSKPVAPLINKICFVLFICIGIMFAVITYYPPNASIFLDTKTGTYGILHVK